MKRSQRARIEAAAQAIAKLGLTPLGLKCWSQRYWYKSFSAAERAKYRVMARAAVAAAFSGRDRKR